mgnify:FL=1
MVETYMIGLSDKTDRTKLNMKTTTIIIIIEDN